VGTSRDEAVAYVYRIVPSLERGAAHQIIRWFDALVISFRARRDFDVVGRDWMDSWSLVPICGWVLGGWAD
jgi:hypothetical protein